jgi:hypothetical protein
MTTRNSAATERQLRLIFDDQVISVGLAMNATLGEIANAWSDFGKASPMKPLAVTLTFPLPPGVGRRQAYAVRKEHTS